MSRKNTSVLEKEYYEFFNFAIPVKVLLTGKNKQFLYGELGKLYPCFSEASCFDYKLKLGRKGIYADVVVTEKFILAEYFKNNHKKKIWIPEIRKNCFEKKVIVNKELWIVSALFLLAGIFYGFKLLINNNSTVYELNAPVQEISQEYKPVGFYLRNLLNTVGSSEGQLQSLKWEVNGYKEIITAAISGMKPEELASMKIPFSSSSFQYKNGTAFCEIKILENISFSTELTELSEESNWKNEIRTIIQTNNSTLIWERIDPYSFYFAGECDVLGEKLQSINNWLQTSGLSVNFMEISKSKNQVIVEIRTAEKGGCKDVLSLIGEYAYLFGYENGEVEKMREESKREDEKLKLQELENNQENNWSRMRKIGEIVHEGGNTVVFYKDKDGKIFTREKE